MAEELGFIGCFAIIALFAVLIWRGILTAMRAPDNFERVYNEIMYTNLKGVCQRWQRKKYMKKISKK